MIKSKKINPCGLTVPECGNVTPDGKTNTAIFVGNFIKNSERGNGV